METVYPSVVHPQPSRSDKLWSVGCHLSGWFGITFLLVPLIAYLVMRRESEYVAGNAREALNFHLAVLLYIILSLPLALLVIGIPLIFAISIFALIVGIVGAVKASDGVIYRYPLSIRFIK